MFDLSSLHLPATGGVLVDVGANLGAFYRCARRYMTPSRSLCIEMLGDLCVALQQDPFYFCPNQGRFVVHCALGDRPGKAITKRVVHHPSSSLLPCNLEVGRRLGMNMEPVPDGGQEPVKVETLDRVCLQFGIPRIDLLKIDVQGYEARVLRGGAGVLRFTDRVIIEIILADHYQGQSDPQEIRSLLGAAGLHFVSELNRDRFPDNGETLEVDELWMRAGV